MPGHWEGVFTSDTRGCALVHGSPRGCQGRGGSPKAIDFYAFSWDLSRNPAGNVVEPAQRKSQSCLYQAGNLDRKNKDVVQEVECRIVTSNMHALKLRYRTHNESMALRLPAIPAA